MNLANQQILITPRHHTSVFLVPGLGFLHVVRGAEILIRVLKICCGKQDLGIVSEILEELRGITKSLELSEMPNTQSLISYPVTVSDPSEHTASYYGELMFGKHVCMLVKVWIYFV